MLTNASRKLVPYLCLLLTSLGRLVANPINIRSGDVATEFIILHNNDMHARFEQTSRNIGKCTPELANANQCYGGFARVAHEVRKYRKEAENGGTPVLYLNAGDTYSGTTWFSIFKDNITTAFLNKLQPDAISLGNHEFDEGVEGLVPFLNKAEFPVLVTNLDLSQEPELAQAKSLANSTVLNVKDVKIGVIGYLTPDTKKLTRPNNVIFNEEIGAINEEAARLKDQGINIIIALGHSGYKKDQEIAAKCPDVDIVIGGHTNTFLYNGDKPDVEEINGPYPTMVKQSTGKEVPVVQAYAYTKYLGKLHVQFDKDGNLIEFDGSPILLNSSVPRDDDILELLEVYRPNITLLESQVVGHTKVELVGKSSVCRTQECNLGNLLTDSMIHARVMEDFGGAYWTDAAIAFLMGGGIRSSIEKRSDGSIYKTDVIDVLNHHNDLYMTKISGKTILAALERSAGMEGTDSNGGFLQMSGVHVIYDYNNANGSRVLSAEVRCAACAVPEFKPLDMDELYNVIVPEFLLKGGDGHTFVENNGHEPERLALADREALESYLGQRDFVYPGIEERITIIERKNGGDGDGNGDGALSLASSLTLIMMSLITLRFAN